MPVYTSAFAKILADESLTTSSKKVGEKYGVFYRTVRQYRKARHGPFPRTPFRDKVTLLLRKNGPMTATQLAFELEALPKSTNRWMQELRKIGVFSTIPHPARRGYVLYTLPEERE